MITLLFLAYLQTIIRNPLTIQLEYELTAVLLFGMMLQSFEIAFNFSSDDQTNYWLKAFIKILPSIITSTLLNLILHQELVYSLITPPIILLSYYFLLMFLLKSMTKCFTFGESTIVTQGLMIFLYNCFLKLPAINEITATREQLNMILQCGLLGVLFLLLITRAIPFFRIWFIFFAILTIVVVGLCLIPIGRGYEPAAMIMWTFVFDDIERIIIVGAYILFLTLAGTTVSWQIKKNRKSSTAIRKVFHILIVLVYVPGLIYQCYFLYVASVVIFAILIVLELARVIKLYPVAEILEEGFQAFMDEQDAGNIALTPLYLLVGCSLPIWIHNSPCDLINSSSFELLPLLSGLLSIGVGDTFASIVGSKIGRHKWNNSQKSVEGTIASIITQGMFLYALYYFEFLQLNTRLMALCGIAVIFNALVEAFTVQVDNLVLPIVTYIILAYK